MANDRSTFTVYPLWQVWLGRYVLYSVLLMLPVLPTAWLAEQVPPSMKVITNVVVMPLSYAGLY